jgi:hypothetical protein
MTLALLVALALTTAMGTEIAVLATPRRRADAALRFVLAPALGMGASTACLFVTLLAFGSSVAPFLAIETVVVAGLAFVVIRRLRRPAVDDVPTPVPAVAYPRWATVLVAIVFAVGAASAAYRFWSVVDRHPHGTWDAWAIWNQRARFLAAPGDAWTGAMSDVLRWSHPDYPLLLPLDVAQYWIAAGARSTFVPAAIGAVFTASAVALLTLAVARFRGVVQGLLAGLVLIAASGYVEHGAAMYADVPLSFFVLTTVLALHLRAIHDDDRYLLLAGISASMAAWTKNEGLLFLVVAAAAALPAVRGGVSLPRRLKLFAAGAAPLVACLLAFKTKFRVESDMTAAMSVSSFGAKCVDWSRHREIATAFFHQTGSCFGMRASYVALPVLAVHSLATGGPPRRRRLVEAAPFLVVAGLFAAYYAAYLVTPYPLAWHISSSVDRLFFQAAPSVLLCVFLRRASQRATNGQPGAATA